ncbi:MAG TPA: phosphate ABC transporter permease PstA [Syntrophobacteraceae bacterium]|nr:phosphate ABC transporter permease PstA [Syntrophobacteraceae bacterium]
MKKNLDFLMTGYARLCAVAVFLATSLLLGFLIKRGLSSVDLKLFFGDTHWLSAITGTQPVFEGIWPAVVGTLFLVLLSSAISIPTGVASGVYLSEYASGRVRSFLGFAVDVLSGTPSIVMGLFGFTMILFLRNTLLPQARPSLFLAAVCIALLILPYVIRTTQTALEAIPEHLRLLGPSLGLSHWHNIRYLLVPLAGRGILSGVILAIGRAAEDTAVILLTGVVARAGLPASLWDKFEALPFRIYYLAAEHRSQAELDQGFGAALVLLLLTGFLFLAAFFLHAKFEKRWKTH